MILSIETAKTANEGSSIMEYDVIPLADWAPLSFPTTIGPPTMPTDPPPLHDDLMSPLPLGGLPPPLGDLLPPPPPGNLPLPLGGLLLLQLDDIKMVHHPSSRKATQMQPFGHYRLRDHNAARPHTPVNEEPWRPFQTRLDFDVAHFALHNALNKEEMNALISLLKRAHGRETVTLKSHADMYKILDGASHILTPYEKHPISVPLKNETHEFEFHMKPLWEWALDLAGDPVLSPHFVWDAQRVSKFNGTDFVRMYHEPWMANKFWEIQSKLPSGAKPFCFILYADKIKLSSFGGQKGYPIIARCRNLPVDIQNNDGIGGGHIVGWLPVFKCGDSIVRWLFLFILILSADYEKQCVMTLIRGIKGKCPCPVCLVPGDKQIELSEHYPFRTVSEAQALLAQASELRRAEDQENLLKAYSLRPIQNCFSTVQYSDVFCAVSWDRLHAYHLGPFRDHLWAQLKEHIMNLGRAAEAQVDDQAACVSRWRDLNHFDFVMKITFSDGHKFEDLSKIIIFASHNIFDAWSNKQEYLLLQCIRSYFVLDMYAAFDVHTDDTIAAGEQALLKFEDLIKKYASISGDGKNWNFPKIHSHKHLFDDIRAKDATRNYNTKPNEKLHGALKDAYALQTNKKDVANQILKIDHYTLVTSLLQREINSLDEYRFAMENDNDDTNLKKSTIISAGHIILGASQPLHPFHDLEMTYHADIAFKNFSKRLSVWLSDFLPANGIDLLNGRPVRLTADDTFKEYRFLKVKYESMIDWQETVDYLHCSPKFYGSERRDCVLVNTVDGLIFARLLFIFTCIAGDISYPIALIHPLDAPTGLPRQKDKDLGFIQVRAKARESSEFISVRSIVHGALLVDNFERQDHGKLLVIDVVDPDMFMCLQNMHS
ncbi:hypothetical protein EW146_g8426 [Bondarzewia mesenterica]|uniref:Uncharacterized protein n=1 Tax=Bondarzewia mesenterica TaxID=1095465 RepID=A0A4S4LEG4_9AGAM|nr:hypothetical protein EW146_g8426 [Bondarzewia mesenterica]